MAVACGSHERARGRVQVDEEVAAVDALGFEVSIPQRAHVETLGLLIRSLDQEAVLACPYEEVGGHFDRTALEEHLEPAFLAPAHAVEDGDQSADDARGVLDGADRGVFDVVAEHVAGTGVHLRGRSEEPAEDVGTVDRVLQERAAARVVALRTPGAVAGYDITGRPVLVVAQRIAHRRAQLVGRDEPDELVDQRVEPRMEADLRGEAGCRDERAHLLHGVEPGRERLLAQERLARGDDRPHEVAVRRRRRHDDDRVDVGIVDHGLRVGRDPLEGADAARRCDRLGRKVGDGHGPDVAVVGE